MHAVGKDKQSQQVEKDNDEEKEEERHGFVMHSFIDNDAMDFFWHIHKCIERGFPDSMTASSVNAVVLSLIAGSIPTMAQIDNNALYIVIFPGSFGVHKKSKSKST